MNPLTAALRVARWEFARYFKLRQQLIGFVIMNVAGLVVVGVMRLANTPPPVADVAVLAASGVAVPDAVKGVRLVPEDRVDALPDLLRAVEANDLDGVLQLNDDYSGALTVRRESGWVDSLRSALGTLRRDAVLERERVSSAVFADALAPAALEVVELEPPRAGRSSFIVTSALMLVAIMTAMGTIFASITGEKQIRVTEQVLSAIPPQAWMDGKILGIAAVSVASVSFTVAGIFLLAFLLRLAGIVWFPYESADAATLMLLLVFALLGLLFWLSFLAAVAAIVDDPQTSMRGGLIMLPMLLSALAFFAFGNPDGPLMRVLALLPPTAPTSMPARLLLTDVHPLEPVAAIALLVAAVFLMRLAAGRVFRTAMLMYGKEPSWREIRRWVFARR